MQFDQLGQTLAEGRSLLANVQAELISKQVQWWLSGHTHCRLCGAPLGNKDSRSTVLRTVYGKVIVKSPRLRSCTCEQTAQTSRRVVHPLSKTLTRRVTPELEYLQAKWAAHLPYRQATTMLKELLPLNKGISFSGARNRIHTLGKLLDADIERDIAKLPQPATDVQVRESSCVAAVSVDSAWLRSCYQLRSPGGHVNIVTGRATFTDGPPKLYAYVHKEVKSAAARLDQFLSQNGVASDERVTVISDDAGEFAKTVESSQLARGRILEWFHIAMKFQAAQRSVFGSKMIDSMERESVETEIIHAKWLVWHGKGNKALERIRALDSRLLAREGYEFNTLWWNLNTVSSYLKNNGRTLVNYGARHRNGLPISSIAESAVNQVVSHRMAKKQQMLWTDEGAHCMAQVRVAIFNQEFSPQRVSELEIAASLHGKCIWAASPSRDRPTNRAGCATLR